MLFYACLCKPLKAFISSLESEGVAGFLLDFTFQEDFSVTKSWSLRGTGHDWNDRKHSVQNWNKDLKVCSDER